jgi:hypothetical protein
MLAVRPFFCGGRQACEDVASHQFGAPKVRTLVPGSVSYPVMEPVVAVREF